MWGPNPRRLGAGEQYQDEKKKEMEKILSVLSNRVTKTSKKGEIPMTDHSCPWGEGRSLQSARPIGGALFHEGKRSMNRRNVLIQATRNP